MHSAQQTKIDSQSVVETLGQFVIDSLVVVRWIVEVVRNNGWLGE